MSDKCVKAKKVNITAPIPVRTVNPVVFGKLEGVMMTPANILKCLIGRATVYEVLSDGSLLKLNDRNYNKVNTQAVKYPEHKEIAQQKSAVISNSFSRKKNKPTKKNQTAMNTDLQSFVDSKFIPQSTGPEKTFSAPPVDGDEGKGYKQVIEETIPSYLKGIDDSLRKGAVTDEQVAAAQAAAKEVMENASATAGQDEEVSPVEASKTEQNAETLKAVLDLVREQCGKITYDFSHEDEDKRFREEAKKLLMEIGGYSEELATELADSLEIVHSIDEDLKATKEE